MNYLNKFRVAPGGQIRLKDFGPPSAHHHEAKKSALATIEKLGKQLDALQFRLYAEQKRSLLICLQALDTGERTA